jgi:hypothetical protein
MAFVTVRGLCRLCYEEARCTGMHPRMKPGRVCPVMTPVKSEYRVDDLVFDRAQCVYFIGCRMELERYVKIGITAPERIELRLSQLQVGNPVRLRLMSVIPGGGRPLERFLHAEFDHLRAEGEWFRANEELMAWVRISRARLLRRLYG